MDFAARFHAFVASRRGVAVAVLVLIALMVASANIVAARFLTSRLDLTAEHLYTLSQGTRNTLAKIDEPITLRFYYSTRLGDEVPSYGVYAQRVRELLDQYVAAAHGKIRLEVYNPQAFSDVEDRAVAFGLKGVPLDAQGEQVYFGLAATNSTDDQQVIAFFAPERERFLEYDLTKLVHSLAFPKKTVVGLMTTLPLEGDMMAMMRGRPSEPMAVIEQLQQIDRVKPLTSDIDAIPADIDVLMLVHPQNLSDKTLFAIDQFVLKGGKALVFVDPLSELQASHPSQLHPPGSPNSSNLERLFKSWGFEVPSQTVVGDRRNAQRVGVPVPGRGTRPLDYIAWLNLQAANLNRDDMITADLSHIIMASSGIIEPLDGAKTTIEPLITTSADTTKIPAEKLVGLPDVAGLLSQFKSDNKRYILAAHVTGMVDTAFPDGPPKPPEPAKPEAAAKPEATDPPDGATAEKAAETTPAPVKAADKPAADWLKTSAQPINVVVVADTDMLDDRFWMQTQDFFGQKIAVPTANNGDFVANAVEVLAGGNDLVGLRSRGTSARPFQVVDRIERDAQERYSAEERALQQKLKDTQAKLADLTGKDQANPPTTLSPEQTKTIEEFRADMLQTRRQLREVQSALRSDIGRLKAALEFLDIALIPIIVAAVAVILGVVRLKRRSRRAAEA
ncbi:MAG: GldG family protein [Alphaproteobacteria bacterium]|nr:GldG family protein [Alphaproteobacteria bacterium]